MLKCSVFALAAALAGTLIGNVAAARLELGAALVAVRAADLRLQTIGDRLLTANTALCVERQAVIGLIPVALSAYPVAQRPQVAAAFGLTGPIGVEALVPGGAADRAGIAAGDELVAIGGQPVPQVAAAKPPTTGELALIAGMIAGLRPAVPNIIEVRRASVVRSLLIVPEAGCSARFELELTSAHVADSDGRVIRVGMPFIEALDDAQLAAIMAHELGHGILKHPSRLDAARVDRGFLSAFGRNAREIRRTEDEADRLSVILLRNAGFDPAAAARFWRSYGAKIGGGLLRSPTHASPRARAALLEAAAAALPKGRGPLCPAIAPGCAGQQR